MMAPLRAAAVTQARTDSIGHRAGQAAPLCRHHKAGELFRAMVRETDDLFKTRSRQVIFHFKPRSHQPAIQLTA